MIDWFYDLLSVLGITKAQDKVIHFLAGYTVTAIIGFAISLEYGILAGVMAGVLKEVYDEYKYGGFDAKDLISTLIGVVVGGVVVVLLT